MRPFDRHVKQPITVCFVQCHVSRRGNVTTITNSRMYFKDSMPRTLNISHILKIQRLVDPDKRLSSQL